MAECIDDAGIEIAFDIVVGEIGQGFRIAAAHRIDEGRIDIARIIEHRCVGLAQPLVDRRQHEALHVGCGMIAKNNGVLDGLQGTQHLVRRQFLKPLRMRRQCRAGGTSAEKEGADRLQHDNQPWFVCSRISIRRLTGAIGSLVSCRRLSAKPLIWLTRFSARPPRTSM